MKGVGVWVWVGAAAFVIIAIAMHTGSGYFDPVANVYLTLDESATSEHCFEGTRNVCEQARTGYEVRGGTLRARVTGIADLGVENGIHRAYASVQIDFDNRYDGWGWSRFDRPILYGFIVGARDVGEGSRRHTETVGDVSMLSPIPPPAGPETRYAPTLQGSCSTDYQHDLCRFSATVPITGDTQYLQIHLRERFR